MSTFSTRLKIALSNKGMRPAVLAYRLGVDRSNISNYLNDRYKPKNELTIKIAIILEVSPAWLHGIEELPTEQPELNDDEKKVLNLFRSALPYQKDLIIRLIEAVVQQKNNSTAP